MVLSNTRQDSSLQGTELYSTISELMLSNQNVSIGVDNVSKVESCLWENNELYSKEGDQQAW
jgi:hypothetical protein